MGCLGTGGRAGARGAALASSLRRATLLAARTAAELAIALGGALGSLRHGLRSAFQAPHLRPPRRERRALDPTGPLSARGAGAGSGRRTRGWSVSAAGGCVEGAASAEEPECASFSDRAEAAPPLPQCRLEAAVGSPPFAHPPPECGSQRRDQKRKAWLSDRRPSVALCPPAWSTGFAPVACRRTRL